MLHNVQDVLSISPGNTLDFYVWHANLPVLFSNPPFF